MEHHRVLGLLRQAGDGVALARGHRIAVSRHHHAQGDAPVPLQLHLVERSVGGRHHHLEQLGLEPHHDRLGLRVAHAAVEFQRLDRAVGRNHQAGVQEAGVRDAVGLHALDGRQDHFAHRAGVHLGRHHRRRRVGAHAAGVGPLVAIEQALVVLAGGQRGDVPAVAHDDEAGFLAGQEFLDHHPRNSMTIRALVVAHSQRVAHQHEVDRVVRLPRRHGDDDTLAGRQAVGLDHDRRALALHIGVGRGRVAEAFVLRRRDAVALHEGLGEGLGAFQLRCGPGRAEDAKAVGAELVDHASGQRRFRADHGQGHLFLLGPLAQGHHVSQGNVFQPAVQRRAAVAGGHVDGLQPGRLGQLPGQRVLTAAAANDEDFQK
jgi:hypothetical protein